MSGASDNGHEVRRVVLPSGRSIEVVYVDEPADASASAPTDLHRCGSCGSGLVYPLSWEEAGSAHWSVSLRCPNCEWCGTGVYDQPTVERFDDELDRGMVVLVDTLKRVRHANMQDDVEHFVAALNAGAILPEDFGTPASSGPA